MNEREIELREKVQIITQDENLCRYEKVDQILALFNRELDKAVLREKIAKMVCDSFEETEWMYCTSGQKDYCYIHADKILSLLGKEGYVKLAEDQSLPETPDRYADYQVGYERAQEDIVEAGWRKVELGWWNK